MKTTIEMFQICLFVIDHFQIHSSLLFSNKRNEEYTWPRHIFRWLAYNQIKATTYNDIGAFENLFYKVTDHSTILNSCKKVENRIETDIAFSKGMSNMLTQFNKRTSIISTPSSNSMHHLHTYCALSTAAS
jgi:chromosomal replication initiation ATPase DnaA